MFRETGTMGKVTIVIHITVNRLHIGYLNDQFAARVQSLLNQTQETQCFLLWNVFQHIQQCHIIKFAFMITKIFSRICNQFTGKIQ